MQRTFKYILAALIASAALAVLPTMARAQCFSTPCSTSSASSAAGDYQIQGKYLTQALAPLPGGPTAAAQTFYVRLTANRGSGERGLDSLSFLIFYNPALADEPAFGKERTAENASGSATLSVSNAAYPEGQNPLGAIDPRFTDNDPQTTHYKVIVAGYDFCLPLLPNHPDLGTFMSDDIVRIKFTTKAGFVAPLVMGIKDNPDSSRPLQETCDLAGRRAPFESTEALHMFNNNELLAVDLLSFTATATGVGGPVHLTWETAAELENIGFNVYRATLNGPAFVMGERLNGAIIPAAGDATAGANYSLLDEKPLAEGEVRSYVLEDIDVNGAVSLHGPVSTQAIGAGSDTTSVTDWQMYDF